jgi:DNA helicase IV
MNPTDKQNLLDTARQRIARVRESLITGIATREAKGTVLAKTATRMNPGDALAARRIHAHNAETLENLKLLYPSPYFTKCQFEIDGITKEFYFGKFSFGEEHIYSWITPVAALRFENPGPTG